MARRPHRPRSLRVVDGGADARGRDFEIVAGAERAATAGQDRHRLARIAVEGEEGFAQQDRGLGIDGIARLGETVDRHDRRGALFLDGHFSHAIPHAQADRAH